MGLKHIHRSKLHTLNILEQLGFKLLDKTHKPGYAVN